MTHTLHRKGAIDSLKEDYVLLILGAPSATSEESQDKMKEIWEVLSHYEKDLVNFGITFNDSSHHNSHRYSMEALKKSSTKLLEYAVFKNRDTLKACLKELKDRDFGKSVVISGLYEDVKEICWEVGLLPHTVALSLGIHGKTETLPDSSILEITTMCGHHLVSQDLVEKMVNEIKKKKMTHEEAAIELSKQCECGVFNPYRAEKLLKKMTRTADYR